MRHLVLFFLLSTVLFADTYVIPWTAQTSQFGSHVVINNHSSSSLNLDISSSSNNLNISIATKSITLDPFETLIIEDLIAFFGYNIDALGSAIFVTTSHEQVSFAVKITALVNSGTSPAQGGAINSTNAATTVVFPFLPEGDNGSISALVISNINQNNSTDVTFLLDGDPNQSYVLQDLLPGRTYANLLSAMFANVKDITGNHFVVAHSNLPILGANFIFNDLLEPSMSLAIATTVDTPATTSEVSFSIDIQPIFNTYCIVCHGTNGGLTLTSDVSWTELISAERVIPGDHENSLLWKRLVPIGGSLMPQGGPPIDQVKQDLIALWIDQGALDN